jgi:hypothetical protein
MKVSPLAGKPAEPSMLVDVPKLVTAYYTEIPDPAVPEQRVAFGTSGHRGSAFDKAFNEWHILAISQAICLYREQKKIDGPLFLGMDTHALSVPALAGALEVLAANRVEVMIAQGDEYTPTPAVSHAIPTYNRARKTGLADGIVITPSHNPPPDGGFKYNPPIGGPAEIRRHRPDRGEGQRVSRERPSGFEKDSGRESSSSSHDAPARLSRCLRYRSRQCARHGRHSRPEDQHGSRSALAAPGSTTGGRLPSAMD